MRTTDGDERVFQTANLFFPRWTNFMCVLHDFLRTRRVPLIARQCTISLRRRGQLCRPIWPPRWRASASGGGSPCQVWSIFKTISVIWLRSRRPRPTRSRERRQEGGRGSLSLSLSDFLLLSLSFPSSSRSPCSRLPSSMACFGFS